MVAMKRRGRPRFDNEGSADDPTVSTTKSLGCISRSIPVRHCKGSQLLLLDPTSGAGDGRAYERRTVVTHNCQLWFFGRGKAFTSTQYTSSARFVY